MCKYLHYNIGYRYYNDNNKQNQPHLSGKLNVTQLQAHKHESTASISSTFTWKIGWFQGFGNINAILCKTPALEQCAPYKPTKDYF